VWLARYVPLLTDHQSYDLDLKKSVFGDFPTYQGKTLSHEVGRGQWMARESQGTNRLIPDSQ